MSRRYLILGSIIRLGYGVLALALPEVLLSLVPGMSYDQLDKDARYFNRMFGGRDVTVALTTFVQTIKGDQAAALRANVLCELTDSASLAQEVKLRGGFDTPTIVGLLFNLVGYRMWLKTAFSLRAGRKAKLAAAGAAANVAQRVAGD